MKKLLIMILLVVIFIVTIRIQLNYAKQDSNTIDIYNTIIEEKDINEVKNTQHINESTYESTPIKEPEKSVVEEIVAEEIVAEEIVAEEIVAEEIVAEEIEINIEYTSYDVPKSTGFKSYMDYRTVTNKTSNQYKLINLYTNTGNYGIRMVDDRYCIAVGTYFTTEIGQYLDLILENGTIIPCVLTDIKADIHTDSSNIMTLANGCVSEFVVDTKSLHTTAKRMGDISYCCKEWNSPVVEIIVYNQNVFDE